MVCRDLLDSMDGRPDLGGDPDGILRVEAVSTSVVLEERASWALEAGMNSRYGFVGSLVISVALDGGGTNVSSDRGGNGEIGGIGKRNIGGEMTCRKVVVKKSGKIAVREGQNFRHHKQPRNLSYRMVWG